MPSSTNPTSGASGGGGNIDRQMAEIIASLAEKLTQLGGSFANINPKQIEAIIDALGSLSEVNLDIIKNNLTEFVDNLTKFISSFQDIAGDIKNSNLTSDQLEEITNALKKVFVEGISFQNLQEFIKVLQKYNIQFTKLQSTMKDVDLDKFAKFYNSLFNKEELIKLMEKFKDYENVISGFKVELAKQMKETSTLKYAANFMMTIGGISQRIANQSLNNMELFEFIMKLREELPDILKKQANEVYTYLQSQFGSFGTKGVKSTIFQDTTFKDFISASLYKRHMSKVSSSLFNLESFSSRMYVLLNRLEKRNAFIGGLVRGLWEASWSSFNVLADIRDTIRNVFHWFNTVGISKFAESVSLASLGIIGVLIKTFKLNILIKSIGNMIKKVLSEIINKESLKNLKNAIFVSFTNSLVHYFGPIKHVEKRQRDIIEQFRKNENYFKQMTEKYLHLEQFAEYGKTKKEIKEKIMGEKKEEAMEIIAGQMASEEANIAWTFARSIVNVIPRFFMSLIKGWFFIGLYERLIPQTVKRQIKEIIVKGLKFLFKISIKVFLPIILEGVKTFIKGATSKLGLLFFVITFLSHLFQIVLSMLPSVLMSGVGKFALENIIGSSLKRIFLYVASFITETTIGTVLGVMAIIIPIITGAITFLGTSLGRKVHTFLMKKIAKIMNSSNRIIRFLGNMINLIVRGISWIAWGIGKVIGYGLKVIDWILRKLHIGKIEGFINVYERGMETLKETGRFGATKFLPARPKVKIQEIKTATGTEQKIPVFEVAAVNTTNVARDIKNKTINIEYTRMKKFETSNIQTTVALNRLNNNIEKQNKYLKIIAQSSELSKKHLEEIKAPTKKTSDILDEITKKSGNKGFLLGLGGFG